MGNNASNRSRPVSIYTEDELLNFNGVKSLSTDNNNNTTQIGCNSIISELEEDSNVSLNLRFHEVRGKNIELRENGRQAVRSEKSFCDAIVFTQRPVRVYEKVYFRIGRVSTLWNGMIRFGFSSVDPEALRERPASDSLPSEDEYDPDANFYLPKYLYPTLTNKKGYWAGALGNECLLKEHDVFYFFYNFEGEVHYGVNHKWMGKFLEGVDVYGDRAPPSMQPLWAVFDVYGNTLEIELLEADYDMQMNLNSAAHSSRHHRRSDRMSSLMAPLDGPMNLRTMSIVNSAASDANHNHNLTAASSSSSHSSDNTVVMNPSNMNLNSLGDSIYSSTSSEGSNGSTLSANSVLWANSIMTTVIPTNRLTSNGNFNRQLHVPNQVVMRPKPATTSTNGRPEESNSRLTSNTPDKNNSTSSQIDRLLISCRRLCVDNHLNQTLHNSILEANNTTKAQMTSPTTVMTSSNQRPSQIVSRTATEGNMNRAISDLNTRIREFYESIPVLLHDSCTVRRSMYRFMTSVCGKNVNVCQPDSLIAYRQSSIAQLRERHNSQGTNSSSSSSQETAIRRAATQNAYVFLDKPVEKGKYVCIQIVGLDQSAHESSASLSIGCTTCQPSTLSPDIDLPDDADELVDRPEYWVVMKSIFSLQHVARKHQVALADELCFHVDDKSGNVRLFINGTLITECLFSVDITQTLYFFFDLCGKINAIRLIAQCQSSNSSTLNNNTAITSGNNNSKRNSALIDYFKSHLAIDEENSNNNEANNNVTNNTTTNRQSKSRESEGGTNECCICWNGPIECVLYTCGHMCLCWNCASALKKQSAKRGNSKPKPATCPICRLEIVDIIRAYRP